MRPPAFRHAYARAASLFLTVVFLVFSGHVAAAQQDFAASGSDRPSISLIRVEEPITPTTTDYINRALAEAVEAGSNALVVFSLVDKRIASLLLREAPVLRRTPQSTRRRGFVRAVLRVRGSWKYAATPT